MEAIDALRHPPPDAPDANRIIGKMDGVLPILAPMGNMPMADRLRAVKSATQAITGTACSYRPLRRAFDLPAATLGLAAALVAGAGAAGALLNRKSTRLNSSH